MYETSAMATAAKSSTNKLDRVQSRGLCISEMEEVTDIKPLTERRNEQVLIHSEMLKRLLYHPACEKNHIANKEQAKKTNFQPCPNALSTQHKDIISNIPTEMEQLNDTDNMNSCLTDFHISRHREKRKPVSPITEGPNT